MIVLGEKWAEEVERTSVDPLERRGLARKTEVLLRRFGMDGRPNCGT